MTVTMVEQMPGYGPPTPVPIFQWEEEFVELLRLYRDLQPKRVLELGSYYGGTLYHWLQNAQPNVTIVSVDSYAVGVDNRDQYLDWAPHPLTLYAINGNSHHPDIVAEVAQHGPYDFVFIDAGHYYEEVKADWELYRPMVRSGGVVVFHDILPPSPEHPEIEVARLWNDLKALGYQTREIVADPNASWGGIGIVTVP